MFNKQKFTESKHEKIQPIFLPQLESKPLIFHWFFLPPPKLSQLRPVLLSLLSSTTVLSFGDVKQRVVSGWRELLCFSLRLSVARLWKSGNENLHTTRTKLKKRQKKGDREQEDDWVTLSRPT